MTFEIVRMRNGKYRAKIYAANGKQLFVSEAYERRAGAHGAVDAVRRAAAVALLVDRSRFAERTRRS